MNILCLLKVTIEIPFGAWESRPCTVPGQHNRAKSAGGDVGEPVSPESYEHGRDVPICLVVPRVGNEALPDPNQCQRKVGELAV